MGGIWSSAAYSPDLNRFVVLHRNSSDITTLLTSTNGKTWDEITNQVLFKGSVNHNISWLSELKIFVVGADTSIGSFYISVDGLIWTKHILNNTTESIKSLVAHRQLGGSLVYFDNYTSKKFV